MPSFPARICPGCRQRVVGKCAACENKRQKHVNARRTVDKSFYDSTAWQIIRAEQLQKHPFCIQIIEDGKPCGAIARHVDHIIARVEGGSDHHDNLQSLCVSCHSRKTCLENGGFGRRD